MIPSITNRLHQEFHQLKDSINENVQNLWLGACEIGAYANASRMPFSLRNHVVSFLSSYAYTDEIPASALLRVTFDVDAVFQQKAEPYLTNPNLYYCKPKKALHLTISAGDVDLVRDLLEYGTKTNFDESDKCVPYLHHVLMEKRIPFEARRNILLLLLEYGASVDHFSRLASTPETPIGGRPLCVLLRNSSLSEEERIELATILVQQGATIQAEGTFTDSRLRDAIDHRNFQIALFLLENAFNPNTYGRFGWGRELPIHEVLQLEALTPAMLSFLTQLLQRGAHPNYDAAFIVGDPSLTPLSLTLSKQHLAALPPLLQHNARPDNAQQREITLRLPSIVASFFRFHPELQKEVRKVDYYKQYFNTAFISPHESVEEQFAALNPEEQWKYQQPAFDKVLELYENNSELAAFVNPLFRYFEGVTGMIVPEPAFQERDRDYRGTSLIIAGVIAPMIFKCLHIQMNRLDDDVFSLVVRVRPSRSLTTLFPREFIERFYELLKAQFSHTRRIEILEE